MFRWYPRASSFAFFDLSRCLSGCSLIIASKSWQNLLFSVLLMGDANMRYMSIALVPALSISDHLWKARLPYSSVKHKPLSGASRTALFTNVIPSGSDLSHSNPGTLISGSNSICFLFLLEALDEAVSSAESGKSEGMLRASGIALSLSYLSFSDLRRLGTTTLFFLAMIERSSSSSLMPKSVPEWLMDVKYSLITSPEDGYHCRIGVSVDLNVRDGFMS